MGTLRRIIREAVNNLPQPNWVEDYEPFWYKHNAIRLGGSLNLGEHDEWELDENIKKWKKEERLHLAPLVDYTFGVYVIKGDDEVIDYILNKFTHENFN